MHELRGIRVGSRTLQILEDVFEGLGVFLLQMLDLCHEGNLTTTGMIPTHESFNALTKLLHSRNLEDRHRSFFDRSLG